MGQLKGLNDIELKVKQVDIDKVIQDPTQYAMDYIEEVFVQNFKKAITSYNLGQKFAKQLLENGKKDI